MRIEIDIQTISLALAGIAIGLCIHWWMQTPPSKTRQLSPLLVEIDSFAQTNGAFPTSCTIFQSYGQLTQNFSVYSGKRDSADVTWEPAEVSRHDFTLMVVTNGYVVFLPVGRMKPISFSSFPVWRYDSSARHWDKGRIHWSYGGSYWSHD